MQVSRIQNQTSFKGVNIASAKVMLPKREANFELYKITESDAPFLNKLSRSLNFRELLPNLTDNDYRLWNIIKSSLFNRNPMQEAILITRDNIPCGGIKYNKNRGVYNIDARITWPINAGQKEPMAGSCLTLMLYKLLMKDDAQRIRTCATRNTSFDTVSKCMNLGFSLGGGDDYNELMSISRGRIQAMLEKYKKLVLIEEKSSEEDVPMDLFLKINQG